MYTTHDTQTRTAYDWSGSRSADLTSCTWKRLRIQRKMAHVRCNNKNNNKNNNDDDDDNNNNNNNNKKNNNNINSNNNSNINNKQQNYGKPTTKTKQGFRKVKPTTTTTRQA